ncbi:hypothetical protein A3H22_00145 [Candidatus Peribacteria bacterium RIFCSPLOWO2_12_FULL_55_15]|nr:MAG: hypothetical protein A2789_01310 [Candidatus Peribacteria bacterium RIFCSPHIGHO2_01_FULL_54_22]OGJ63106.1 MAG: hypothetical protein A3D12_02695 [Candidatus Peribacteria bacterium RIFCSPHIGHO2_02_FULL_55_24]OGJ64041.1 MAG: hypothetical protein A3E47_02955 [Candidatus Peribacteria bacterium RIFCSPHIGHO2_12_FULL_54_10]OGJ68976.1 MAG: hypothetical protein A2947_03960 [Candidatus Peribacteria bacterium RIFCSPLOWO2_01_FULL_54_110]OGJ70168.1 MAG: hypothetical protein A3H90_00485 [Candidatus Pe
MESMHPDPILEREAECIVQATRGMGKVRVKAFPSGNIVILVQSRRVKKRVEELLGTLNLRSKVEVLCQPYPCAGSET